MQGVLQAEGVRSIEPVAVESLSPEQDQTLLCFVLMAPGGKHAFCRCAQPHGCCCRSPQLLFPFQKCWLDCAECLALSLH